jgi:glycosyltransferase involved in cell wall biosynthesis
MAEVLLTVSGVIDPARPGQVAAGERPRADYFEMARAWDADLLDYAAARRETGRLGRWLAQIGGPDLALAWACFRRRSRYRVIFTDGEQVGIPLAWLLKFLGGRSRPRHLMIVHVLSVRKKEVFFDYFGIQSHIDTFFVYSTWQKQFIETRWHVPPERVVFTPFMVDARFFSPDALPEKKAAGEQGNAMPGTAGHAVRNPTGTLRSTQYANGDTKPIPTICAVGLERRDYPTLIEAVRGLDVHLVVAAASPWSKRADTTTGQEIPPNVTVQRFNQHELRQVYADSRFLVMPLYDVDFQAGVTAILEAMAMERAVICSRTPGQTDVIVEGETGLYVPPGDVTALRGAIQRLLDDPQEAERMGRVGRRLVEDRMSLDRYVARLGEHVRQAG